MNSDDKLKELGNRLDVSDEEIRVIKKSKWYRVNPVIYIALGAIGILSSLLGYSMGRGIGTYPFRIFLGPFAMITAENKYNKLKVIGLGITFVLVSLICFIAAHRIGYVSAPDSGPTIEVIDGSTYTIVTEYGIWSL